MQGTKVKIKLALIVQILSNYSQNTYLYKIVDCYNKLPKQLTLIKEPNLLKKMEQKYKLDKNTKLSEKMENMNDYTIMIVNDANIEKCENMNI